MSTTAWHLVEALLFEAEPLAHPYVLAAYEQAIAILKKHRIPFRPTGGIALNLQRAGRPTKDVDLIVPRRYWHLARAKLQKMATDSKGIHFGLPDEPADGLAFLGPHGVAVEVWPEGTTHQQIARIRGRYRAHPAAKLSFTIKGNDLVNLINAKLASYLSATDRLQDASDVQSLIKKRALQLDFANKLAPAVRNAYRRIWQGEL